MASITIQPNGTVVFSQAVIDKFPEITATVSGSKITIGNVYLEELVSLVGNNIFWSDTQPFSSFSIEFTNNHADVDVLSNLMVRYINYHNGDYTVAIPKYSSDLSILKDPLNLGVKPNYYKALLDYANGTKTIDALANDIKEIYLIAKPTASINIADIITVISTIQKADILKFLNQGTSIMSVYNATQDAKSKTFVSTGTQKYSLSTASKEFEMIEDANGIQTINKLCASDGEDVRVPLLKMLPNMTSISYCLFKQLTPDEFFNSKITTITTDFGASVSIMRSGSTGEPYNFLLSSPSAVPTLIGELLADVYLRYTTLTSTRTSTYFDVSILGRRVLYGSFDSYFNIDSPTDTISGDILGIAKKYVTLNTTVMASGASSTPLFEFNTINADIPLPKEILSGVVRASGQKYVEQYFIIPTLQELYAYDFTFANGELTPIVSVYSDETKALSIVGTALFSKIKKVIFTTFDFVDMYYSYGFNNIYVGTNVILGNSCTINSLALGGVDHFGGNIKKLVSAGIVNYNTLAGNDMYASLHRLSISVATVPNDKLLLCDFASIGAGGIFASDADPTGQCMLGLRYILVNGTPLPYARDKVMSWADAGVPIVVSSSYSVRVEDIALFQNIIDSLVDGYKRSFRFGTPTIPIDKTENRFAGSIFCIAYDGLFANTDISMYKKLISIASGVDTLIASQTSSGSPILNVYLGVNGITTKVDTLAMEQFLTNSLNIRDTLGGLTAVRIDPSTLNVTNTSPILFMSHTDEITGLEIAPNDPVNYTKRSFNLRTGELTTQTIINGVDSISGVGGYSTSNVPAGNSVAYPVTPNSGMLVKYNFAKNADGSVDVTYKVLDANNNDITSQFSTLTLDGMFSHKGV
jgi:hypothetical protein